jgi:hypothetical protein
MKAAIPMSGLIPVQKRFSHVTGAWGVFQNDFVGEGLKPLPYRNIRDGEGPASSSFLYFERDPPRPCPGDPENGEAEFPTNPSMVQKQVPMQSKSPFQTDFEQRHS